VRGYLVSDAYPRLAATPSAIDDSSSVYPPDLKAEAARAFELVAAEAPAVESAVRGSISEAPARIDRTFDRIARTLEPGHPTRVSVVRYSSLDAVGHYTCATRDRRVRRRRRTSAAVSIGA
jgi:hypothetical protein